MHHAHNEDMHMHMQALEDGIQEADAWRVLRGILSGLAHIHGQGVIHRDLKVGLQGCSWALRILASRAEIAGPRV